MRGRGPRSERQRQGPGDRRRRRGDEDRAGVVVVGAVVAVGGDVARVGGCDHVIVIGSTNLIVLFLLILEAVICCYCR